MEPDDAGRRDARHAEAAARTRERAARDDAADARALIARVGTRAKLLGPVLHGVIGPALVGPPVALALHGGSLHAWLGTALGAALSVLTSACGTRLLMIGGGDVSAGLRSTEWGHVVSGLRRIRVGALVSIFAPVPTAAVALTFAHAQMAATPTAGGILFVAPVAAVAFGWLFVRSADANAALRRLYADGPVV